MSSVRSLRESDELGWNEVLLFFQAIHAVYLLGVGCFVLVVMRFWPSFFHHPNLTWTVSAHNLERFWGLFLYAAVMAVVSAIGIVKTRQDGKIFALDIITSVMAGVSEEIGYRWFYVCTAMVGIAVTNWLLGSALGAVIGVIVLIVGVVVVAKTKSGPAFVGGLFLVFLGILTLWIIWRNGGLGNPLYWMYDHVTVPIVNIVTLGFFQKILYNPAIPPLFVFGMVAANAAFRDGHKYQGFYGRINAWIIGFIMMYAAITYGIGTAIAIHAIYDIEFGVIRYGWRKLFG